MSDECECGCCQPEREPETFEPTEAGALVQRQAACIDDLLGLIGYLPEGLAILARYGLER